MITSQPTKVAREILYANDDYSIVLLDLPASIEEALDNDLKLNSCEPFHEPIQNFCEPRKAAVKEDIRDKYPDVKLKDEVAAFVRDRLTQLKAARGEDMPFCLRRCLTSRPDKDDANQEPSIDERNLDDSSNDKLEHITRKRKAATLGDDREDPSHFTKQQESTNGVNHMPDSLVEKLRSLHATDANMDIDERHCDNPIHNGSSTAKTMRVTNNETCSSSTYIIPAHSTFSRSKCSKNFPFQRPANTIESSFWMGIDQFDFILLDPPWSNRSALRKRSYEMLTTKYVSEKFLHSMHVGNHLLPGGYIAIWTTNKAAVRNMVLRQGGLFSSWGVELVEEWIWVKITAKGDPILPLESTWRKPWETLLIGKSMYDQVNLQQSPVSINRRVIFAVPDVHSRKPCLKSMIEAILFRGSTSDYVALEMFSRYLVKSWYSWGDETLKYNHEGEWGESLE